MIPVSPWFGRRFAFAMAIEQYPTLSIRLRGAPARLEELIRDVPHARLTRQTGGKWSPQEHAGHLLDLESLWLARVEDFRSDRDTLTVADLSNRKTDEANHNGRNIVDIVNAFRAARVPLVDYVDTFTPDLLARSRLHPRLQQPMRLVDHLYFVAEHDDHHLATIWEAIRA